MEKHLRTSLLAFFLTAVAVVGLPTPSLWAKVVDGTKPVERKDASWWDSEGFLDSSYLPLEEELPDERL